MVIATTAGHVENNKKNLKNVLCSLNIKQYDTAGRDRKDFKCRYCVKCLNVNSTFCNFA
jgi:hypothetical protein